MRLSGSQQQEEEILAPAPESRAVVGLEMVAALAGPTEKAVGSARFVRPVLKPVRPVTVLGTLQRSCECHRCEGCLCEYRPVWSLCHVEREGEG